MIAQGSGTCGLFCGPAGTGKTMAAAVIAGHLGLGLYRIDLAAVVSKHIGETEKNLRRVFDAAENSGAVLFFDEADGHSGTRIDAGHRHDRHANVGIDDLLGRTETDKPLAIVTSNLQPQIDAAFPGRPRFVVECPAHEVPLDPHQWHNG